MNALWVCYDLVMLSAVIRAARYAEHALIGGLKSARESGDMRIARPAEQARTVLQLTTLDRVLRPYATIEEALAGF